MADITKRFDVSGMHCGSCSMLVDMTLKDLPGVIDSKTSHADGSAEVTFDDTRVNENGIVEAIKGVGYEAKVAG